MEALLAMNISGDHATEENGVSWIEEVFGGQHFPTK